MTPKKGWYRVNKKYENENLINRADKIATELLRKKRSNGFRDHFFPAMIDALGYRTGAEIGVDKAGFTISILTKSKIEQYFCVDTWQDNFGSDHKPEYFAKDGDVRFNEAKTILKPYLQSFEAPSIAGGRVQMLRMTSVTASEKIPMNCLDFCYIDGDHSLFGIYDDLFAWVPKVKAGGMVAGHDYKDGENSGMNDFFGQQLDYKIKTVVDNYCAKYGYKLNVSGGVIKSWWFIKNR